MTQIFISPDGGTFTDPVDVEIEYCADAQLDASTRSIKLNSVDITSSFTYENKGPECASTMYSDGTITLIPGTDTLVTSICSKYVCSSATAIYSTPAADRPIVDLSANAGSLLRRDACVTSDAGQEGAYSCGNLLVAAAMPVFRSRDRDRALTLLYNSAAAGPPATILADIRVMPGVAVPDSIQTVLTVNAIERGRWTYSNNGLSADGRIRRIALALDTSALPTGAYPFTVTLNSYSPSYPGGMLSSSATDTVVVINRRNSPYGMGWDVAGTDQIFTTNVPATTLLLVEGDGSYALYTQVSGSSTQWIAPMGAYRDTLVQGDASMPSGTTGGYRRKLLDGTLLYYNATGRHIWTIDRAGDTVQYAYRDPGSTRAGISSISVAPRSSSLTYTFAYSGATTETETLTSITDPAGRSGSASISSGKLNAFIDPLSTQNPTYSPAFPGPFTLSATDSLRFGYDGRGNMNSWTSRRGATTNYTYQPGTSVLASATMPVGGSWSYQPSSSRGLATAATGNVAIDSASVTTVIDGPAAAAYTIRTNKFGSPVQLQDYYGHITSIAYAPNSPLLASHEVAANGRITWASYDERGRVRAIGDSTYPAPNALDSTIYFYDDSTHTLAYPSKIKSPIEVGGARDSTVMTYTTQGLPFSIRDPRGNTTSFLYTNGQLSTIQGPLGKTRFTYSTTLKNLETVHDTSLLYLPGFTTTYHYDAAGRVRQMELPGRINSTYFMPNVLNQMEATAVWDTVGVWNVGSNGTYTKQWTLLTTQYDYDRDGNDTLRLDPRGAKRTRTLDAIGRLMAGKDEFGRSDSLFYTGAWLGGIMRRNKSFTAFDYDSLGREVRRASTQQNGATFTMPTDTVYTTYDRMGNDSIVENTMGRVTRIRSKQGFITSETQFNKSANQTMTFSYTYTPSGLRRTMLTPNGGTVSYKYGPGMLVDSITWDPSNHDVRKVSFTYDALLNRSSETFVGGPTVAFQYDVNGMLLNGTWASGASGFTATALTPAGELKTYTDALNGTSNTVSLAYDNRGEQIQDASGTYLYDENGNRVRFHSYGIDSTIYYLVRTGLSTGTGSDRLERAVTSSGSLTTTHRYTYDGSGWLVLDSLSGIPTGPIAYQHGYYASGKLWTHDLNNGTTQYRFDGTGRMIMQRGQGSLNDPVYYDGDNPAVDGSLDIIHEPGVDVPVFTATCYVISSNGRFLGGVSTSGDPCTPRPQTGAIEQSMGFSQIRQPDEGVQAGFTGLSFFRNRWYDANTGRFTQEDPVEFAGGANLYAYSGNNAASYADPFGLCPPQWLCRLSSFSAGFGDAVTFGATNWVRNRMGTNSAVDRSSGAYLLGAGAGVAASAALGGAIASAGKAAAVAAESDIISATSRVTFSAQSGLGHGARHLIGTGLSQSAVEQTIAREVIEQAARASATGEFYGRVSVEGQTVLYKAFTHDGIINIGTYFIPK